MSQFDPFKPFRTRDGQEAKLIAVLDQPLHRGETILARLGDDIFEYLPNGRLMRSQEDDLDLVNVPPQTVRYFNMGTGFTIYEAAKGHNPNWPVMRVVFDGSDIDDRKVASAEVVSE